MRSYPSTSLAAWKNNNQYKLAITFIHTQVIFSLAKTKKTGILRLSYKYKNISYFLGESMNTNNYFSSLEGFNLNTITDFFGKLFTLSLPNEVMMYVWLSAGVFFLLLELLATGLLFFFPFTFGCVIAGGAAYYGFSIITQCVLFLVLSAISFFVLQYYFGKGGQFSSVPTNTDALINKIGVVTKTIEPQGTGRVKIKGEEWPAESRDQIMLQKGTYIHVTEVRGTKLVVK